MSETRHEADLKAAKDMFFFYEGSTFYMSRNGDEEKYKAFGVPPAVEAAWLRELTTQFLEGISEPGNWRTVSFLEHHSDFRHIDQLLQTSPVGKLWEQCAFLELRLLYLERAAQRGLVTRTQLELGASTTVAAAEKLSRGRQVARSRARIDAIERRAETLLARDIRVH